MKNKHLHNDLAIEKAIEALEHNDLAIEKAIEALEHNDLAIEKAIEEFEKTNENEDETIRKFDQLLSENTNLIPDSLKVSVDKFSTNHK